MVHWSWDVSFGQVIVSVPIFWLIYVTWKMSQMMMRFRIEHEYLMQDWANRQVPPVRLQDMPTRQTKWW